MKIARGSSIIWLYEWTLRNIGCVKYIQHFALNIQHVSEASKKKNIPSDMNWSDLIRFILYILCEPKTRSYCKNDYLSRTDRSVIARRYRSWILMRYQETQNGLLAELKISQLPQKIRSIVLQRSLIFFYPWSIVPGWRTDQAIRIVKEKRSSGL